MMFARRGKLHVTAGTLCSKLRDDNARSRSKCRDDTIRTGKCFAQQDGTRCCGQMNGKTSRDSVRTHPAKPSYGVGPGREEREIQQTTQLPLPRYAGDVSGECAPRMMSRRYVVAFRFTSGCRERTSRFDRRASKQIKRDRDKSRGWSAICYVPCCLQPIHTNTPNLEALTTIDDRNKAYSPDSLAAFVRRSVCTSGPRQRSSLATCQYRR